MDIQQELPSPLQLAIVQPVLATKGQRFKGHLLDFIFFCLFYLLWVVIVDFILRVSSIETSFKDLGGLEGRLYNLALFILYYFPQELLLGKTFGKRVMGTRAVREDGTEMTVLQTLGRTLCRLIPFDAWSFFLSEKDRPRGWHDNISKTMVIVNKLE